MSEVTSRRVVLQPSTTEIIFAWFQRVIAGYCLLFGILYWIRLIGFYPGALWRFDLMPVHWQVAAVMLAVFFPFAAADGTIGCYFQLDAQGTNKLMQHTVEFRDGLVIAFVNAREAASMTVGKKITDGLLTIPSGFTPEEIVLLQTKYPTIGKEKEFDAQRKKSLDAIKQYKKQQAQQAKAAATPKPKP